MPSSINDQLCTVSSIDNLGLRDCDRSGSGRLMDAQEIAARYHLLGSLCSKSLDKRHKSKPLCNIGDESMGMAVMENSR